MVGGRTQKLLIAVAVGIGVLAAPVAASAFTSAARAREALIRAQLNPRPLYPDILPTPLGANNSATFTHGVLLCVEGPQHQPRLVQHQLQVSMQR